MTQLAPELAAQIAALAHAEHLVFLGVAALGREGNLPFFRDWLEQGMHAEMAYISAHAEVRADSSKIMPEAKSALLFALPYSIESDPPVPPGVPQIARYARLRDYHRLLRSALQRISSQLHYLIGAPGNGYRIMVDSVPLFERALAARTGHGFIGRNSCYILPGYGSYIVLAEIVTTAPLAGEASSEMASRACCRQCGLCQKHCPTGALNTPYTVDARRCLSYWTIEHQGPIPEEIWPHFNSFYFGCDICQQVCPFNREIKSFAAPSWIQFKSSPDLMAVATMDQKKYEELCGGSPLTRAKIHGIRRNALIAMHITSHTLIDDALAAIDSSAHPVLVQTKQQILRRRFGKVP